MATSHPATSTTPIGTKQTQQPAPPLEPSLTTTTSTRAKSKLDYQSLKLTWEMSVCDDIRTRYKEFQKQAAVLKDAPDHDGPHRPFMCAVVGIPGSGKTTSASVLADILGGQDYELDGCFLMPFDGYHIPMKELLQLPNAEDAIYRRGAPDTFDATKLMSSLEAIRYGTEPTLSIPGFDHAKGDPEDDAHLFDRNRHKIVIVEGLYLLHDQGGWEHVKDYFDYSIYVDASIDVCMERLKTRNKVIPGYTPEEIDIRVERVDRTNALTVQNSKARADRVVQSAAY